MALEKGYTMDSIRSMPWDEFIAVTGYLPKLKSVKVDGRNYACMDISYWDPEKKVSTHKRKIVGYYDADGNMIATGNEADLYPHIYLDESNSKTVEIGRNLLFDTLSERTGLRKMVERTFGEDTDAIMTCAYYIAGHHGALCLCERWSKASDTPYGRNLSCGQISELIHRITPWKISDFLEKWREHLGDNNSYALDIAPLTSYDRAHWKARTGYNRDDETPGQPNLALLIGKTSRLPSYYIIQPGDANGTVPMRDFVDAVNTHGFSRANVVTDRGFCVEENLDTLCMGKHKFVMGLDNRFSVARNAICRIHDEILKFDNYSRFEGTTLYCMSDFTNWITSDGSRHQCYTHVFVDQRKREEDIKRFLSGLERVKDKIIDEKSTDATRMMASDYLTVSDNCSVMSVEPNRKAIDRRNYSSGFHVVMSNHIRSPREILRIHYEKEESEPMFDDLWNDIDSNRLGLYEGKATEGRVFLSFLGTILRLEMLKVRRSNQHLSHLSGDEIVEEMSLIYRTTIDAENIRYSNRTKLQRIIIDAFGIEAPFRDPKVDPGSEE